MEIQFDGNLKAIKLSQTIIDKSLLLQNLAEDNLLQLPTTYPGKLTTEEIEIVEKYLVEGEIPRQIDDITNIIKFFNYFCIDDIVPLIKVCSKFTQDTYVEILKLQQHLQHCIIESMPTLEFYHASILEGLYITLSSHKDYMQKSWAIKLSDFNIDMKFPDLQVSTNYRPALSCIQSGHFRANIKNGSIDLSQSFWLKNFPWDRFDVSVAGGYIVSSLQGILSEDQDIDLYLLNQDQLRDLLLYFRQFGSKVGIRATYDNRISEQIWDLNHRGRQLKQSERNIVMITLTSPNQRDLQLICSGTMTMHETVRMSDLTHLRIWIDKDGLWADIETIYELLAGFTRAIGFNLFSETRIEKYSRRGWDIYGDKKLIGSAIKRETGVSTEFDILLDEEIENLVKHHSKFFYDYHDCTKVYIGYLNFVRFADIKNILSHGINQHTFILIVGIDILSMTLGTRCNDHTSPMTIQVNSETYARLLAIYNFILSQLNQVSIPNQIFHSDQLSISGLSYQPINIIMPCSVLIDFHIVDNHCQLFYRQGLDGVVTCSDVNIDLDDDIDIVVVNENQTT